MFPPSIWKPSEKDLRADFNPIQKALLTGASAAAVSVTTATAVADIPTDKVLLVSNVFGVAVPGAAQIVTRIRIRWGFLDTLGNFIAQGDLKHTGTIAPAANVQVAIDWQPGPPGFPLLPGQVVHWSADFNAGAAANQMAGTVAGVLVPRGNWQRD